MNARFGLVLVGLSLMVAGVVAQSTQPVVERPELTPRQQDLLLQLSDAEANIQAINKALKITGYKVGLAYDQIDSSLKGNELMNRQGGGPVRWDEFYGKTANDYPRTGFWDDRMDDHRPKQFSYVYKANNDQIARAKSQVAALAENRDALLDRRHVHEEDQSRLWATLAWEQVKDREIEFRSLYRYSLKPSGAAAAALSPVTVFLRKAANVAQSGLDTIGNDESSTFQSGSRQMDAAYIALERSLADALDASDRKPDEAKQAKSLKASCKELAEQTKVIADDYANALDRDKAREDDSKLQFRGQLQSSLSNFATQFGKLDDQITSTAAAWGLSPDKTAPIQELPDRAVGAATEEQTPAVRTLAVRTPAVQSPAVQSPATPTLPSVDQSSAVAPGTAVTVHYTSGGTELDSLKNGAKFFTDRKYVLVNLPDELMGLTFARRGVNADGAMSLDCPEGSTVYMIVDSGTDPLMQHSVNAKLNRDMVDSGWSRLKDNGTLADKWHHLVIYKTTVLKARRLTIAGIDDHHQGKIHCGSIVVAAASLRLSDDDRK